MTDLFRNTRKRFWAAWRTSCGGWVPCQHGVGCECRWFKFDHTKSDWDASGSSV